MDRLMTQMTSLKTRLGLTGLNFFVLVLLVPFAFSSQAFAKPSPEREISLQDLGQLPLSANQVLREAPMSPSRGTLTPEEELARFSALAARNDPFGQFGVGVYHEFGLVAPQNLAEAIKLYRKSAEQDFAAAQNRLGE